jgi:hypothetical protein
MIPLLMQCKKASTSNNILKKIKCLLSKPTLILTSLEDSVNNKIPANRIKTMISDLELTNHLRFYPLLTTVTLIVLISKVYGTKMPMTTNKISISKNSKDLKLILILLENLSMKYRFQRIKIRT